MTLIAKVDPPLQAGSDGRVRVHARPYEKPSLQNEDQVFVWLSENAGGAGLAARGELVRSSVESFPNKTGSGVHEEIVLIVQLDGQSPNRRLSLTQIGPYRDRASPFPISELSRVLYKHAHNKVTSMDARVAEYLNGHFGP